MTDRFFDEKQLRKLWQQPLSLKEIGEKLDREHPFSAGTVRQRASQLGLGPRPKKASQTNHWRRTGSPEQIATAEAKRLEKFAARREAGIRNRPRDIKLRRKAPPVQSPKDFP